MSKTKNQQKHQVKIHSTGYLARIAQDFQDCEEKKKRKTKKLSQTRGVWGDRTSKCSVVPWTGSQNRKRTLTEKLMKSK